MSTLRSRLALAGGAVVLYFLLIGAFQYWSGASGAAFGGYPDESSHYLSGLMIHDYCASGFSTSPVIFASNYYTHLPFFGIGYWPPFFYAMEAVWMALFGFHRAAVLLLPALVAAFLSGTIFWLLRDRLGAPAAFLTGCLLLFTPALLESNALIMVDNAFALFGFWAALAFGRWIDTGSVRAALLTGLLTAFCLLTKINAIYLILLLPLILLILGRWRLLLLRSFWVIPAVVAVLWGPWIFYTRNLVSIGFGGLARPDLWHIATGAGLALLSNLGWILILVLAGGVLALRKRRLDTSGLVCVLLPVCYLVFLLAARVEIENRFLIPILAPSMVLAGVAVGAISEKLVWLRLRPGGIATALSAVMLVSYAATLKGFTKSSPNSVRPVVEYIRERDASEDAAVLVPSDAEGPFIAEFAADEKHRPLRFMVRPNKLLSIIDWNGGSYQARFHSPAELISLFDGLPIRYTIISESINDRSRPDDRLLASTLNAHPERWKRLDAPVGRWLVYERIDGRTATPGQMADILSTFLDRLKPLSPGSPGVQ